MIKEAFSGISFFQILISHVCGFTMIYLQFKCISYPLWKGDFKICFKEMHKEIKIVPCLKLTWIHFSVFFLTFNLLFFIHNSIKVPSIQNENTVNWVMYERKFCERNIRTNCVMKHIGIILQCNDFLCFLHCQGKQQN